MNKLFKIIFVVIWILASVIIFLNIIFIGFVQNWIIILIKYLYVTSLISLFINSSFLTEETTYSEKLIEAKSYNLWGLLLLIAIITGVLLYIGSKSSVILIMAVCTFLISIWLMLKYQKLISKSLIINGLILGLLCSIAMYQYFPTSISIFIAVPCFFISGSILNSRFQITIININNYSYVKIIKSFLIGCFFALPMAISNCSDAISSNGYKWITHFWQPILAFNMVVLEETWVRLFIITFIFALVSSKTNKKFIPILASILISSTIFGFTHYPNIDIQNCFNIVILYGLPLGVLFYKRDFETVIGYHFMINIIGAISAYFLNSNLL